MPRIEGIHGHPLAYSDVHLVMRPPVSVARRALVVFEVNRRAAQPCRSASYGYLSDLPAVVPMVVTVVTKIARIVNANSELTG